MKVYGNLLGSFIMFTIAATVLGCIYEGWNQLLAWPAFIAWPIITFAVLFSALFAMIGYGAALTFWDHIEAE